MGSRTKARRGELRLNLPIGLDRDPDGRIQLTADEQIRAAIERVYALWRRCASARQVVSELDGERQLLPRRSVGEQRVRWEPASFGAVHDLLTNPVYAGAFVYGRTRQRKTVTPDGQIRTRTELLAISEWRVCLPDHHPGYGSWTDYLATQDRLRANARGRGEGGGAAREGSALLQGLVRCGRCGRRMMVAYSGTNGRAGRYLCSRPFQQQGTRRPCQGIGALRVDRASRRRFSTPSRPPAGVDATAHALETLQTAHQDRVRLQRLAVENATYEAERARRQYDACEPEHRLVARTLEHALETALAALAVQQRALRELERQRPAPLSDSEQDALKRLAADLPRVWDAPTTSDRDRKQLLRCLLDNVVLTVDRDQQQARVELFWQGGAHTELTVALNRTPKRTDTPEDLVALIRRLAEHSADAEIAMILAKQRHRTATGLQFTATRVAGIRERAHIPAGPRRAATADDGVSIHEAARQLWVCTQTIRRWLREGLLPAEQTAPHAPWRIKLATTYAAASSPRFPPATCVSQTPPPEPASRARRSAAATATPSTSLKAGAADSASSFTPKNRACCPQ